MKKNSLLIVFVLCISFCLNTVSFGDRLFSQKLGFTAAAFENCVKENNLDELEVLNGGEVRFLKNNTTDAQQLSAVFKSSDGKVIVVDGGWTDDKDHLVSVIKEFGGTVDAWLITHPQADHVGALSELLTDTKTDIIINNIYYNFFSKDWYKKEDEEEYGSVSKLMKALEKVPEEIKHSSMVRDDSVEISPALSFRVMNSPVKTRDYYAVNASGLMFDITIDSKHFIMLGDMSAQVGDVLMSWGVLDNVTCDYVQLSHHGQDGVSEAFYKKLNPKYCIWPTTYWLFTVGEGSGYKTHETKAWISKMGVKMNYATLTGDVVIK